MGKKTDCLTLLKEKHINVHEFREIFEYQDLLDFVLDHCLVTIRFDRYDHLEELPFYIIRVNEYKISELEEKLKDICKEAGQMKCSMLCSNGLRYDDVMLFNFVGRLLKNNQFEIEFSTRKVPLRKMYQYPTRVVCGNLADRYKDYEFYGDDSHVISRKDLELVLAFMQQIGYTNQLIEGSCYEVPVGVYHKRIVCWQIQS